MADDPTMRPPQPKPRPAPSLDAARDLLAEGDRIGAIEMYEALLTTSTRRDAREHIASQLLETSLTCDLADDPERALRALDLAITVVDWADVHARRGMLLAQRGRRREAIEAYDRALAINPRFRGAAVERALLDAHEGRLGEAMAAIRALASDTSLTEPRALAEGLEALRSADIERAAPLLRRAMGATDTWLDAQLRHYQQLSQDGDLITALHALRAAVSERPGYPDLHYLLGVHELQLGSVDDALESLAHALELHPDYTAARVEFARALETSGDTQQALAQLDQVLAIAPDHAVAGALRERWTGRQLGSRRSPTASE